MNQNSHQEIRKLIATSADLSEAQQALLHAHLQDCSSCRDYAGATAEIVRAVRGIGVAADSTLVLRTQARVRARAIALRKRQHVQFRIWAAFAVALSMSFAGSALVYQMAKRLALPMHFDIAQVQAGVLVFWLLPSLCAALCLLAAPGENRGIA
jgi:predicted anti-sigma-YlaC factor YlaD